MHAKQYMKLFADAGFDAETAEIMASTFAESAPRDVALLQKMIEEALPSDVRPAVSSDRYLTALVGAFAQATVDFLYASKVGELVFEMQQREGR